MVHEINIVGFRVCVGELKFPGKKTLKHQKKIMKKAVRRIGDDMTSGLNGREREREREGDRHKHTLCAYSCAT